MEHMFYSLFCLQIGPIIRSCKLPSKIKIKENTPTGASTNPKNFDLNKNLNMNLI